MLLNLAKNDKGNSPRCVELFATTSSKLERIDLLVALKHFIPSSFPIGFTTVTVLLLAGSLPAAAAQTYDITATDTNICLVQGDSVRISTPNTGSSNLQIFQDRRDLLPQVATLDANFTYHIDWLGSKVGHHLLQLVNAKPDGQMTAVRQLTVDVLPASPLATTGIPDAAVQDVPVTLTATTQADFTPASVNIVQDDAELPAVTDFSKPFVLNIASMPAGDHHVQFIAVDAQGGKCFEPVYTINVPERITLAAPSSFSLTAPGQMLALSATPAAGLQVTSVDYSIDGTPAASISQAPYSSQIDLSKYHTGVHTLAATLHVVGGQTYDAGTVKLDFVNQVEDKAIADAAAAGEARQEAAARAEQAREDAAAAAKKAAQERRDRKLLDNTMEAGRDGLLSLSVSSVDKSGDTDRVLPHWLVVVTIRNDSDKWIKPKLFDLRFDDYSDVLLLAVTLDANGEHFLNDDDLVIAPNSFKAETLSGDDDSVQNHTKKPTSLEAEDTSPMISAGVPRD